jgi:hypothetical protein
MRLIGEGALAAGFSAERLHSLPEEERSHGTLPRDGSSGDLVVLTPSAMEAAWARVQRFTPTRETLRPEHGQWSLILHGGAKTIAPGEEERTAPACCRRSKRRGRARSRAAARWTPWRPPSACWRTRRCSTPATAPS